MFLLAGITSISSFTVVPLLAGMTSISSFTVVPLLAGMTSISSFTVVFLLAGMTSISPVFDYSIDASLCSVSIRQGSIKQLMSQLMVPPLYQHTRCMLHLATAVLQFGVQLLAVCRIYADCFKPESVLVRILCFSYKNTFFFMGCV